MEFIDQNSKVPSKGDRISAFVTEYLSIHKGLTLGELAFRLRCDKRDLQRLVRDRSVGHTLEDRLHSYFGRIFGEAVYGDLWGAGPSKRERELEIEKANLAARRERLERDRAEARQSRILPSAICRVVDDKSRGPDVSRRR